MNIIKRIVNANNNRDPERLEKKYRAMRTDPFVFLRGTCHLFYDRLPKNGIFRSAPLTWCCGDLHLQNFGTFKGDNRLVYFDMNDFDEAALAPVSWELSRMLSSILVAAQTLHISPKEAKILAKQFLESYVKALSSGKALWVERETSQGMIKELFEKLQDRKRKNLLDSRTELKHDQRCFTLDGKKSLPITESQRILITRFMEQFAARQSDPEFYKVLDIARRIAGTGSLGVERYIILVEGKGSPDHNYLLDLKQTRPSSIAKHLEAIQPKWINDAERIVSIQKRMQAVSDAFLFPEVIEHQSYVLQALQPSEDRVPLEKHRALDDLMTVIATMGQCVAWAQLRSTGRQGSAIADELIEYANKKKWQLNIIEASYDLADQVRDDWKSFCKAYDDNAFQISES